MKNSILINRLTSFSLLLVLLMHNVITSETFYGEIFYVFIFRTFTRVAVPVFFTISSFLLFNNYNLGKLKKRTKTLFIPFIIWSTISYVIFSCFPLIPFLSPFFNSPVEISLGSFLNSTFISPKNGSLWFLRDLYLLVLLSPFINQLIKNKRASYYVFCFLGIIWIYDLNYSFMVESTFFFYCGALLSNDRLNFGNFCNKEFSSKTVYIMVLFYIILCLYLSFVTVQFAVNPMIISKILIVVGLLVLYAMKTIFLSLNIFTGILDWFKKYSFLLFVTNSIILSFTKKILTNLSPPANIGSAILLYLISFGLLLLLGCCIQNILRIVSPYLLKVLTGNRC